MDSIIVKGIIRVATPVKSNGQWSSQSYVIEETEGNYPKKVAFEVFGEDKIAQFNLKVGDNVEVYLNLSAREYNGKYYNNVNCWRVTKDNHVGGQPFNNTPVQPKPSTSTQSGQNASQSDINDLPF